ncbi:MAG: hypothetical protein U9Q82_13760 [Chloroflexota bacterium]|nr:hypothetical protein [Chloroflexota bacterium]
MLDDLRDQAGDDFLEEEEDIFGYEDEEAKEPAIFLGMTPIQRFVIAIMILLMVVILGSFCLLVTEKIALPFL